VRLSSIAISAAVLPVANMSRSLFSSSDVQGFAGDLDSVISLSVMHEACRYKLECTRAFFPNGEKSVAVGQRVIGLRLVDRAKVDIRQKDGADREHDRERDCQYGRNDEF
jgi:hypothetical protein